MARDLSGFLLSFPQLMLLNKNTQEWALSYSCIPCHIETQQSANLDSCFLSKSLNNREANFDSNTACFITSREFSADTI